MSVRDIADRLQTNHPDCETCREWRARQQADFDDVVRLVDIYATMKTTPSGPAARDALLDSLAGLYPATRAD